MGGGAPTWFTPIPAPRTPTAAHSLLLGSVMCTTAHTVSEGWQCFGVQWLELVVSVQSWHHRPCAGGEHRGVTRREGGSRHPRTLPCSFPFEPSALLCPRTLPAMCPGHAWGAQPGPARLRAGSGQQPRGRGVGGRKGCPVRGRTHRAPSTLGRAAPGRGPAWHGQQRGGRGVQVRPGTERERAGVRRVLGSPPPERTSPAPAPGVGAGSVLLGRTCTRGRTPRSRSPPQPVPRPAPSPALTTPGGRSHSRPESRTQPRPGLSGTQPQTRTPRGWGTEAGRGRAARPTPTRARTGGSFGDPWKRRARRRRRGGWGAGPVPTPLPVSPPGCSPRGGARSAPRCSACCLGPLEGRGQVPRPGATVGPAQASLPLPPWGFAVG